MNDLKTNVHLKLVHDKATACDAKLTHAIQTNATVEEIRAAYRDLVDAREALLQASGGRWPDSYKPD